MDELLSLKWKNHCPTFLQLLSIIRGKQMYTDVTLACEGKFYRVHRMILTACSDYFRDIFEHIDSNKPVIVLRDITCENLEALLDYMYLGEVSMKQSNLTSLIKAAEYLLIKGLAVADDDIEQIESKVPVKSLNSPKCKRKRTTNHSNNTHTSDGGNPLKYIKTREPKNPLSPRKNDEENRDTDEKEQVVLIKEDEIYIKEEMDEPIIIDSLNTEKIDSVMKSYEKIPPSDYQPCASTSQLPESYFEECTEASAMPESPYEEEAEWQGQDSNWSYPSQFDPGAVENANHTQHIDSLHRWRCQHCLKTFSSTGNLARHNRIHTGEKFACSVCNYESSDISNLKKHVIMKHRFRSVTKES